MIPKFGAVFHSPGLFTLIYPQFLHVVETLISNILWEMTVSESVTRLVFFVPTVSPGRSYNFTFVSLLVRSSVR